jgi:hypothetical protein
MMRSFNDVRENLSKVIKSIDDSITQLGSEYKNLITEYPDLFKNDEKFLNPAIEAKNEVLNKQLELFGVTNTAFRVMATLKDNIEVMKSKPKLMYGDKGVIRLLINDPSYLKPGKDGKPQTLDVTLTDNDDFSTKVEPFMNMIEKSIIFNQLGDYLKKTYQTREIDVVASNNKSKRLKTIKYENRQIVEYAVETQEESSKKMLKIKLAENISDHLIKTYEFNLKDLVALYPNIRNDFGLNLNNSLSKLQSELISLQIKLSEGENLKSKEREDINNKITSIRSELNTKTEFLLKRYPKLAELMKQ